VRAAACRARGRLHWTSGAVTGRVCCLRSADGAASTLAVLPQHVDLGQQRDVSVGHVQAVQRVEHLFEAGDGVVAGLGGGNHHQPAVDVGLLVFEGVGPRLEPGMVGVRSVFGVVEVALCIVELLLQQAVLRRDLGQQVVERVQVACGLQLVVEVVGDAGLVVVHLVRLIKSIARGGAVGLDCGTAIALYQLWWHRSLVARGHAVWRLNLIGADRSTSILLCPACWRLAHAHHFPRRGAALASSDHCVENILNAPRLPRRTPRETSVPRTESLGGLFPRRISSALLGAPLPSSPKMPKEFKKRGRREEEKKRKRGLDDEASAKRHKKEDVQPVQEEQPVQDAPNGEYLPAFHGMLDEEEHEYFKKADEMLELDQFESAEDRSVFLASVWREAEEKELKLANDPSASRLLERLILLSTPEQLKGLFQKFSGQYVHRMRLLLCYANQSQLPRARPTQDCLALHRSPLHTSRARRDRRDRQLQVKNSADTAVV
jgi:hypothetical protein